MGTETVVTPARAHAAVAAWSLHRSMVRIRGAGLGFPRRAKRRALLVTHQHRIAHGQAFPFFLYARELRDRYGVTIREVSVDAFESTARLRERVDVVLFQAWHDYPADRIRRLCDLVGEMKPERSVFLDAMAPTDVRFAALLNDAIDVYVKKQIFRDGSPFQRETYGDTNLMDYFGRLYELNQEPRRWPLPDGFLAKLLVGPGFVTTPDLLPAFCRPLDLGGPRTIDLHARLGSKGAPWYEAMRLQAINTVGNIPGVSVVTKTGIERREYLRELRRSKLCYSPFGYGEIAWRDAEAVACGAVVLKPDMGHLKTDPDLFVPYETYVPLLWNFVDTAGLVRQYVNDRGERERIARQAHAVAREYLTRGRFVEQMKRVFSP